MAYWLMKSEPSAYSWDQLLKDKRTSWSGVRNYLANNNMKAMTLGDEAFFYHSNEGIKKGGPAIVGIMKIVKLWYPDPSDETGRFGMVDVAPVRKVEPMITLAAIKLKPELRGIEFLRLTRLSVSKVTPSEWKQILDLS